MYKKATVLNVTTSSKSQTMLMAREQQQIAGLLSLRYRQVRKIREWPIWRGTESSIV
jgi:hypothetical protein